MKEIKDLNVNDRIIIWRYNDMNIDEGHNATVIRRIVRHAEPQAVVVQLDGVLNEATITDKDYFDTLPLSNQKSEDCENEEPFFVNDVDKGIPSHYRGKDGIDVIEFLRQQMTSDEFKGFMTGNIIKYATRLGRKDDEVKELEKIEVYAKRLKEVLAHE